MIYNGHDETAVMPGPIQIKRPEVTADIRTLAALTGASITDAIATAVKAQLAVEKVKADAGLRKRRKAAEKALAELRRLPVTGPVLTDEDLYDASGIGFQPVPGTRKKRLLVHGLSDRHNGA